MNIKNVMRDILDVLKKKDERACTFTFCKAPEIEGESNCETLNFYILRNIEELSPEIIMFNLGYCPRKNGKEEFSLYIDGYEPLLFDFKHLERILGQCFPNVKEKRIKKWTEVIGDYCLAEFKLEIEALRGE